MICLQGFVGWYMVESGLVNNTTVSHFRLSIHLTLAFIIFSSIIWNLKNIVYNQNIKFLIFNRETFYLSNISSFDIFTNRIWCVRFGS